MSEYADEERTKDKLSISDIETAILSGKVIGERPTDNRGESRLITGTTENRMIHVVIGVRNNKPVIVTVYIPDEKIWSRG